MQGRENLREQGWEVHTSFKTAGIGTCEVFRCSLSLSPPHHSLFSLLFLLFCLSLSLLFPLALSDSRSTWTALTGSTIWHF